MNPEQKTAVEVAEHLHSIEEFQRDVEPAIVAARNEFLTQGCTPIARRFTA
ncbi:MAG: hypothetical protein E6212_10585 [Actinomyces sp.]|nr:hypothetical protein [Actinomyces sp.]